MGRSLALALYLMAARRGASGSAAPERVDRADGTLLWLHLGQDEAPRRLAQLATRLLRDRPELRLLVTAEGNAPPSLDAFPKGTLADLLPPERPAAIRSFLDHWRPDLVILTGTTLPPAMIVEADRRAVPLLLIDFRMSPQTEKQWRWRRGMAASLLGRFRQILTQDPETASRLRQIGGRQIRVEVAGRIEETTEPLPCNEAERAALAELLQARPVWLAADCPEAEEEAVIAAHAHAMRLAHRMLLIVIPAQPARAVQVAERMRGEGWMVAERRQEEEPDPEIQAFVVEDDAELGLWYRLAPVTYMGGTLVAGGPGRNPFEPAALGSAILHGPHPGPYPDAYAHLTRAQASRLVDGPSALAEAVGEMIAADKAAILAHNAWAASSGGAEVAERVASIVLGALDAVRTKAPA